jgi:DNA-binding NarL/FixJ family response regulator
VIRVLIAATSAVVRAGLEALLAGHASVVVVGSVSHVASRDGQTDALADEIELHEPDVVLIDADDRYEVRRGASLGMLAPDAMSRAPAVILLSSSLESEWLVDALRSGVRAVLSRDAPPEEIVAAVESAGAGLVALSREALESLLAGQQRAGSAERDPPRSTTLTPRESEVLRLLAEGLGNKMVAARLGISEHTVKTHIASVFAKLEVYTRAEAVARGIRVGAILL